MHFKSSFSPGKSNYFAPKNPIFRVGCPLILAIYLIINPREYRIVIIESIVSPLNFRNTLAKALFIHFSVPHVCFLPHPSACLFSLGSSSALLIDIGLKETSIVPVFEGVSLIRSIMQTTTSTSSLY
uniref:Uncharacterized protein n=1 Tax=Amphimedon queenslandica TaxID=400682 RepID=A0A1X7SXV2_AMPQE